MASVEGGIMNRISAPMVIAAFILAVLLFNHAFWFSPDLHEVGDLAANALRVENAREFQQLLGPYSQHRFHHPGPACFYFLGLTQTIFAVLPSVLPRHMLGQFLANLVFILLIMRGLARTDLKPPLVAVAGFLLAGQYMFLGGGDPLMLASVWGPNMAALPVILFLVCGVRLTQGDLPWLPVAAAAGAFAFHTHLPTVTPLLAITLTVGLVILRRRKRIAWTSDALPVPAVLGLTGAIVFLALLPILLEELNGDPGNLTLILRFFGSQDTQVHPWSAVIDTLGQPLTDPLVVLAGRSGLNFHSPVVVLVLLAILAAASIRQARRTDPDWRFFILTVWVVLAATVLSARIVPGPLHTYLYYYLYGIVACLQLILFRELWAAGPGRSRDSRTARRLERGLIAALSLALFFWIAFHRAPTPTPGHAYDEIVSRFDLGTPDTIHIHLVKDSAEGLLWSELVTLVLRFHRDGQTVTVPAEYVFLCGEEYRSGPNPPDVQLLLTRRLPPNPGEHYLGLGDWGIFLLASGVDPAGFRSDLPRRD